MIKYTFEDLLKSWDRVEHQYPHGFPRICMNFLLGYYYDPSMKTVMSTAMSTAMSATMSAAMNAAVVGETDLSTNTALLGSSIAASVIFLCASLALYVKLRNQSKVLKSDHDSLSFAQEKQIFDIAKKAGIVIDHASTYESVSSELIEKRNSTAYVSIKRHMLERVIADANECAPAELKTLPPIYTLFANSDASVTRRIFNDANLLNAKEKTAMQAMARVEQIYDEVDKRLKPL